MPLTLEGTTTVLSVSAHTILSGDIMYIQNCSHRYRMVCVIGEDFIPVLKQMFQGRFRLNLIYLLIVFKHYIVIYI